MKKRLIPAIIMMSAVLTLQGCGDADNAASSADTAQNGETIEFEEEEKDTETDDFASESEAEEAEVPDEVGDEEQAQTDEVSSEAPVVYENFDGDTNLAIARGMEDLKLDVVDGGVDGSKCLQISGRTDSWNGANFDCNVFRGNQIRATAKIKSTAKTVRLSIQYDQNGVTAYNWIASLASKPDEYVLVTGTFSIPEDVENIYVYVESDACDDLFVDEFEVKAEGEYKQPKPIEEKQMADISEYASMKEAYADYFDIGVCINPATVSDEHFSALILQQFSSATCENNMKPEAIIDRTETIKDTENGGTHFVLNFDAAKTELDFARDNGIKMRGHTLVWHSQTPDWIFYKDYDTKGELADRELMLLRTENYMKDVFTWADENYPGLFYAWDVVNEAFEDNGTMRDSYWRQTIGDDYLEQVFALARKYAPDYIKLFYNDYNAYQSSKQSAIIEALKPAAEAGNLNGIGMQGHLYTGEDPTHFAKCAKRYVDELGVVVHITEIDVTEPSATSPEGEQGKYYGQLFKALRDAKKDGVPIESVSIWGLTDALSWKASERPLVFNSDLSGKIAFFEIIENATKE